MRSDKKKYDEALKKEGYLEITKDFKHPYQEELERFQSLLLKNGIKHVDINWVTDTIPFLLFEICDPEWVFVTFYNSEKTFSEIYALRTKELRDDMVSKVEDALERYSEFMKIHERIEK